MKENLLISIASSMHYLFECKFLLRELSTNKMSYQIFMSNKNSKFLSSKVVKQSTLLFILES